MEERLACNLQLIIYRKYYRWKEQNTKKNKHIHTIDIYLLFFILDQFKTAFKNGTELGMQTTI